MFGATTEGTTVPKTSASTSLAVEARALDQLGDAELAELDRREVLERRSRLGERRADAGDDGDAPPGTAVAWHAPKLRQALRERD